MKFFLSIVKTLIAFVLFWASYNVLTPLSSVLETILSKLTQKSETLFAEEFTQLIIRALKIAVMIVGFIIILSQWGINVIPLLGGLGILGMAVGFGAQDSIANIFGGIKSHSKSFAVVFAPSAHDKINKFDAFAKKLGMSATSKVYKRFKI